MDPARPDVAIVGGGLLGMTLARRLAGRGVRVTILEGGRQAGEPLAPPHMSGFTWDRFYHLIRRSDSYLLRLLKGLGLQDKLRWAPVRNGMYSNGQLHPLSSARDVAFLSPLSTLDRLRMAATMLRASRIRDWKSLEGVRAVDWLSRWSGRATLERIWLPLLRARLGASAEHASAAAAWALIARMYAGVHQESAGYLEGGCTTLLSALTASLSSQGVQRRSGATVIEVTSDRSGATVSLADGECLRFDAVVMTVPCSRVATMCPQLSEPERIRLRAVPYQGILCVALLLRRPLAGYHVTSIADPAIPFTSVVDTSALVKLERSEGHSLVYLPRYAMQDDPCWDWADSDVEQRFVSALEVMYSGFRTDDVLACQVSREREILAVSTVSYSTTLAPPIPTSASRLFVVNSAQVVNGTMNANELIALAYSGAEELLSQVRPLALTPSGLAGAA